MLRRLCGMAGFPRDKLTEWIPRDGDGRIRIDLSGEAELDLEVMDDDQSARAIPRGSDGAVLFSVSALPLSVVSESDVADSGTALGAALASKMATTAAPGVGTAAFADLAAKADANVSDVNLLIVSDSTAAVGGAFVDVLVPLLAARFPRHSIRHAKWQDGSPGSYAAAVVTPGSGARSIYIWNASVAGKTWQYHFDASRWPTMLAAVQHDAVFFSLGHNDNPAALNTGNVVPQRSKAFGFIEDLRTMMPSARIVLGSQNPLTAYPLSSQHRADMLRSLAQIRGFGFVDVCKAFLDDGRDLSLLVSGDGTHPTADGYGVWAARVAAEFPPGLSGRVPAQLPPAFAVRGSDLLADPTFAEYTGSADPTGWSFTNATHSRNITAGRFESGSGALQIVKAASGSASYAQNTLPLPLVRGRLVTFAVRMYALATTATPPQVSILDNVNVVGSETWRQEDQWHWRVMTAKVPLGATFMRVRIYVDASNGAATPTVIVDRVSLAIGDVPVDPAA